MRPISKTAMMPGRCCGRHGRGGRSYASRFADAGYQGPRVAAASPIRIEIVRKLEGQVGFAVHARRWVVERFFALDQPKPPPDQRCRGEYRLGRGFPRCRLGHQPATQAGTLTDRSETES